MHGGHKRLGVLPVNGRSRAGIAACMLAVLLLVSSAGASAASPIATASDYDCSDFGSQAEAQEHLLPGDPDGLDADGDEIACESNPCPCSTSTGSNGGGGGPTNPPPPPEPPKLRKAAAKQAAWAKARRFDQRNTRVRGVMLNGCVRRSKYQVNCRLVADGKVGSRVTICNIGVIVRGEGSDASARLRPRCRSYLELSAARAIPALRSAANEVAEKPAELQEVARHSLVIFTARAWWTRSTPTAEECSALVIAELNRRDEVEVRSRDFACSPL